MIFMSEIGPAVPLQWAALTIVCIKYYVLSMFLCYNFYIDGNIPFRVLLQHFFNVCVTDVEGYPPYLCYISAYLVIYGNYEGSRNCSEYLTEGLGSLGVDIFYLLSETINIWCRVSLVGKMNYKSDSGLKTTKHHRNHFNPFSIEGSCLL